MSLPSLSDLARAIAGQYPARHGFLLTVAGTVLRVRTNSPAVEADLRGYFGPLATDDSPAAHADMLHVLLEAPAVRPPVPLTPRPQQPGKRADKERFADVPCGRVVRKQATGMLFLFGPGQTPNIAIGPCEANRNQLVNFLLTRYMERGVAQGWLLGHAAGAVHQGRGLALCGFAGMGKSTLALHLVASGWDFLSNDRVLVEPADLAPDGRPLLHGIPKHPRLNPGTVLGNPTLEPSLASALPAAARATYAHLPAEELRLVEDKFDANIHEAFGPGRFASSAPLCGVVVLNWTHGGGPLEPRRVELSQRPDLLEAFRKRPGLFYLPEVLGKTARLTLEDYSASLAGVPALELCGGSDFEAAGPACIDFLNDTMK